MNRLASIHNPIVPSPGQDPESVVNLLGSSVNAIITFLFIGAFLFFFIMLIWGGINFILSGGDKEKTAKAKEKLTAAVIGIVVVLLAFALVNLISYIFGVNFLNLKIPRLFEKASEKAPHYQLPKQETYYY